MKLKHILYPILIGLFSPTAWAQPEVKHVTITGFASPSDLENVHEVQLEVPGCKPIQTVITVNDELTQDLKKAWGFKTDDFYQKRLYGNDISYLYLQQACVVTEHTAAADSPMELIHNAVKRQLQMSSFAQKGAL